MIPICVKHTDKYGRGIFATRDIKKDELVEVSPLLICPNKEWKYLKKTNLMNYCFVSGELKNIAIALGNGSLFNHSYTPNTRFQDNQKNVSIDFYAIDDIKAGEELTINYNGNPEDQSSLWFSVIE